MTLMRLTSGPAIDAGSVMSSCSAPSVRTRTRTRVVLRLDVHVGGAVAHRLLEDQVDDLDDRRVLVDLDDDGVAGIGELLAALLGALLEVAQGVVDFDARAVAVIERPLELVLRGDDDADRCLEQFDQPLFELLDPRVAAGDDDAVALYAERDRPQLARGLGRKAVRDLDVELVARKIDGAESELRGERHRDVARRQDLGAHEDLTETRASVCLLEERGVALSLGDVALRDEDVAQRHPDRFGIPGLTLAREARQHGRAELVQRLAARPTDPQPSTSLSARTEPSWPGDLRPSGRRAREEARTQPEAAVVVMSYEIRPPERMKLEL